MTSFKYGLKKIVFGENSVRYNVDVSTYLVENPTAFCHSYEPIEFYQFNLGTKVRLKVRDDNGGKVHFVFRSYFGIGRQKMLKVFDGILEKLWNDHFEAIFDRCIVDIEAGKMVTLSDFRIDKSSIMLMNSSTEPIKKIEFKDARLKRTHDQLIVNSIEQGGLYIAIKDRWDWNAFIIQSIIEKLCPS